MRQVEQWRDKVADNEQGTAQVRPIADRGLPQATAAAVLSPAALRGDAPATGRAQALVSFYEAFGRLPLGAQRRIHDLLSEEYPHGLEAWEQVEKAWHEVHTLSRRK